MGHPPLENKIHQFVEGVACRNLDVHVISARVIICI